MLDLLIFGHFLMISLMVIGVSDFCSRLNTFCLGFVSRRCCDWQSSGSFIVAIISLIATNLQ